MHFREVAKTGRPAYRAAICWRGQCYDSAATFRQPDQAPSESQLFERRMRMRRHLATAGENPPQMHLLQLRGKVGQLFITSRGGSQFVSQCLRKDRVGPRWRRRLRLADYYTAGLPIQSCWSAAAFKKLWSSVTVLFATSVDLGTINALYLVSGQVLGFRALISVYKTLRITVDTMDTLTYIPLHRWR